MFVWMAARTWVGQMRGRLLVQDPKADRRRIVQLKVAQTKYRLTMGLKAAQKKAFQRKTLTLELYLKGGRRRGFQRKVLTLELDLKAVQTRVDQKQNQLPASAFQMRFDQTRVVRRKNRTSMAATRAVRRTIRS